MNTDLINSRIQELLTQLLARMTQQLNNGGTNGGVRGATNGAAPQPTWIYATPPQAEAASAESLPTGTAGDVKFADLIEQAAAKYKVDAGLIASVIKAESNFNPKAQSGAGAQGLMQLMPGTAAGLGVSDAFDPVENINGGAKLLHQLLTRYKGDVSLALAAYNAGPGAVDKYGGIPPYSETQTYVKRVLGYFKTNQEWSA